MNERTCAKSQNPGLIPDVATQTDATHTSLEEDGDEEAEADDGHRVAEQEHEQHERRRVPDDAPVRPDLQHRVEPASRSEASPERTVARTQSSKLFSTTPKHDIFETPQMTRVL